MNGVRVAAIHAMQASNAPTAQAFKRVFPEACVLNLMDDALAKDVAVTGIDEAMHQRFEFLARYAKDHGKVEGVLFTCSAFGSAIEHVQRQLGSPAFPILKPNEAMQQEAVDLGGDIAVLSMFEPTLPSIEREMLDMARSQGKRDLKLHVSDVLNMVRAHSVLTPALPFNYLQFWVHRSSTSRGLLRHSTPAMSTNVKPS
uniref:Arylsulfatase n=1 Tax=Rhizochromulina marina TaxID=1034831 RepID=A0A7S2SU66_9STRA|mmetsp:Transcript_6994/g.20207  ORF Transcript_6994/g.20207 Transcript_6994/m.20207 type:complete len:200 (+) Transcript_6994:69-668(+)